MALQVQIHGGPRDGEYVAYMGPTMRLPVPPPVVTCFLAEKTPPLLPTDFPRIDEYELRRGWDGEMYYVRRPG